MCVRVLAISVHNIFRVIHHDDVRARILFTGWDTDRVVWDLDGATAGLGLGGEV